MPKLIFLILCQSEVALSATPKARFAPVVKNEVASGLYKPPREGSEKICSTLPSLTDFSLEVSESGGQQVALASARVGDHHVEMRKKSPLVWKADGVTKAINIRPYEFAHESKRCFNFKANTPTGLSEAGKFMRNMYKLLGKEEGTQAALQLAFCKTLSGPVVGIGLRRNEEGLIIGFEHILLLGRRVEIEHAQEGPRSPSLSYEPVRIYHLPSGRYKATPRKTDRVCSTLPLLTSFEMKVWEYDGQQAAKMTATVADRPVGMAQGVRLACYGDSFVRRLNFTQYGFPKKKPENCFRFQDERDVVEKFMRGLYTAMGEPLTRRQDSSIVICKCTSIILVGMILETKRHRTRGFKNILFLDGPLAIAAHEQIDSVAPATLKGRERERPSAAVGAAKEHESVPRKQLAFGTYTSKKESTAGLCSTFPLLTGFEFEVSEIDGQQVALATAYVGDQRIVMREKSRLVRYSDVHVGESRWGLTEFFTFKADKGWGMSAAGEFVRRLYRAMGKEEPRQAATHLAFYEVRFGLLVLLDSKWSRGDGSPAPGSLFSGEFPEDFLDKWLLFPELFSPVNLEPTEDVQ
ncbi:hypothetical protein FOZ61_000667 [Perkinsus olseni]|uniref:Uncharacterized protein n=1 Tax=Perkinsus olseni TaxID=32597 RepID=A0A7J6KU15_PEROL|nr:hypothetical protein FOZ61_000667 [Perkinsus olseni]